VVYLWDTKNGKFREAPYAALPPLRQMMEERERRTREVEKRTGKLVPWVFHRNGKRVKDFREAWRLATKAAGLEGTHFHDLRRSAVRQLERVGAPRSTAMSITGHKTESVYTRYAIADRSAQDEAFKKLAALVPETRTVVPMRAAGGAS